MTGIIEISRRPEFPKFGNSDGQDFVAPQHAMFEGAVLLRGVLLAALSHSARAEPGGALKWEGQCGTMLGAAEGRANAASAAWRRADSGRDRDGVSPTGRPRAECHPSADRAGSVTAEWACRGVSRGEEDAP